MTPSPNCRILRLPFGHRVRGGKDPPDWNRPTATRWVAEFGYENCIHGFGKVARKQTTPSGARMKLGRPRKQWRRSGQSASAPPSERNDRQKSAFIDQLLKKNNRQRSSGAPAPATQTGSPHTTQGPSVERRACTIEPGAYRGGEQAPVAKSAVVRSANSHVPETAQNPLPMGKSGDFRRYEAGLKPRSTGQRS